jgi:flavodoxin
MEPMGGKKILAVYCSRTGTTRKIANEISSKLDCDVEEIIDLKTRAGPIGYMAAGRDFEKGIHSHENR